MKIMKLTCKYNLICCAVYVSQSTQRLILFMQTDNVNSNNKLNFSYNILKLINLTRLIPAGMELKPKKTVVSRKLTIKIDAML